MNDEYMRGKQCRHTDAIDQSCLVQQSIRTSTDMADVINYPLLPFPTRIYPFPSTIFNDDVL